MTTIADILSTLGPIDPVVKHRRRRSVAKARAASCKGWRMRRKMKAVKEADRTVTTR